MASYKRLILNDSLVDETLKLGTSAGTDAQLWTNNQIRLNINGSGTTYLYGSLILSGNRTIGTQSGTHSLSINPHANLMLGSDSTDHIYIGNTNRNITMRGETTFNASTSGISWNDLSNKPNIFMHDYVRVTGNPTFAGTTTFTGSTSGISYSDLSNKPTIPTDYGDHASQGYLTSSSTINATTLGNIGLNTTGVNNNPSKVMATNGSGYAMFGWINTISGEFTGTPNRIYASNDQYMRYMTLENFSNRISTQLNLPADVTNTFLKNRYTRTPDTVGDSTGAIFTYMTSDATNKPPGADHALLTMSWSADWQTQMAQDWRNSGRMYIRGQLNGSWSSWGQVYSEHDFTNNSNNWDTAYGWGNHASAGYGTSNLTLSNVKSYIEGDDGLTHIRFDFQDYGPHWNTNDGHSTNNPFSIKLWDSYNDQAQSGLDPYGTILDIYGRSGHERDQFFFGNTGTIRHRNIFYGTNTWNAWKKIWDNSQLSDTVVDSLKTNYNRWLTSHQDISGKANLSGASFTGHVDVGSSTPFLYVGDGTANNDSSWDSNIMLDSNAHSRLRIENRGTNTNLEINSHTGLQPTIKATDSSTSLRLGVGGTISATIGTNPYLTVHGETYLNSNAVLRTNNTFLYGVTSGSATVAMIGMKSNNWIQLGHSGYGLVSGTGGFSIDGADRVYGAKFQVSSSNNSDNWNTAYGWGNHASQGYLTSHQSLSAYAPIASPTFTGNIKLSGSGRITGGFGAVTTAGTKDWNHDTNAISGQGYTLLTASATNGHGFDGDYYHPFNFEYARNDGYGNMTQLAVPYSGAGAFAFRTRYSGSWTNWRRIIDTGIISTYADKTPSWVPSSDPGYLTSHQDLSNYATLNGSQTFTGGKNFSANSTFSSNLYVGGILATDAIVSYRATDTIDIDAAKVTVGGTGSQSNPNKLVLRGHSVPHSTLGHLGGEGWLEFDSHVSWTGAQRRWAITNAFGMGMNHPGALSFLVGYDSSMYPKLDTSGTLETEGSNRTLLGMSIHRDGVLESGDGGLSTNWNTAYGWGNHATQNYAKTTTSISPSSNASYDIGSSSARWRYGYFNNFLDVNGRRVDVGSIDNWNTAYSWGDHASAGYYKAGSTLSINSIDNSGSYTELNDLAVTKKLYVSFPNGVANQKANIIIPNTIDSGRFWGEIIVTIVSAYSFENASGVLKVSYALGLNHSGAEYTNTSMVMVSEGKTPQNFALDEHWSWDSTNLNWYLPIAHLKSTGNQAYIQIEAKAVNVGFIDSVKNATVGSVYTTDTSVFPRRGYEYNDSFTINGSTYINASNLQVKGVNPQFRIMNSNNNYYRQYVNDADQNRYTYYNSTLIQAYSPVVGWDFRGNVSFTGDVSVTAPRYVASDNSHTLTMGHYSSMVRIEANGTEAMRVGTYHSADLELATNNSRRLRIANDGVSYFYGSVYINQANKGLYFGTSNNRIYFGSNRALEGGTSLNIGESYTSLIYGTSSASHQFYGNINVTSSITASGGNSGNWNTAYGWGDHSRAGYTTKSSDIKLKTDVKTIDKPLEKLAKLRGVDFTWKDTNKKGGGVIAQEVEKILPDLVEYNVDVQAKTVDYNGLIGVLIESVKELKNEVETLKAKCNCKGDK